MPASLYERLGGRAPILGVVHGFYARVATDEVLSLLYPADDLEGAEERLGLFLVQWTGGPNEYEERRGHPKLRLRHFPFAIGERERERWMALMTEAVAAADLPGEPAAELLGALAKTAAFLVNQGGLTFRGSGPTTGETG